MTKRVTCREAGYDCDFSVQSENDDELVEFVREHAANTHHVDLSDDDVRGLAVPV